MPTLPPTTCLPVMMLLLLGHCSLDAQNPPEVGSLSELQEQLHQSWPDRPGQFIRYAEAALQHPELDPADYWHLVVGMGRCNLQLEDYETALEIFHDYLDRCEEQRADPGPDPITGHFYAAVGHSGLEDWAATVRHTRSIREQHDLSAISMDVRLSIYELEIFALRKLSRYDEALTLFPAAEALCLAAYRRDCLPCSELRIRWGNTLISVGQSVAALEKLEASLRFLEQHSEESHKLRTDTYAHLSTLYRDLNDYDRAFAYARLAISASDRSDTRFLGHACLNLQSLFEQTHQTDSVESYQQLAERYLRTHTDQSERPTREAGHPLYVQFSDSLSLETAVRDLETALREREQLLPAEQTIYKTEEMFRQLIRLETTRGNYAAALDHSMRHHKFLHRYSVSDPVLMLDNIRTRAYLLGRLNRHTEAAESLLWSFELLNDYERATLTAFSGEQQRHLLHKFRNRGDLLLTEVVAHPHPAPQLYRAAYTYAMTTKGAMLENDRAIRAQLDWAPPEADDLFQRWATTGGQLAGAYLRKDPSLRKTTRLSRQRDSLGRKLATLLGPQAIRRTLDWRDVRNHLRPGEAAIEFTAVPVAEHSAEEQYIAWVLTDSSTVPLMVPLFRSDEMPPLKRTRSLYAGEGAGSLRHLLYDPIKQALPDSIQTIYYAPDGLLHRINFGAVATDEGRTVGERYRLHRLISTAAILEHRQPISLDGEAVVFGGLNYGEGAVGEEEELVSREGEAADGSRSAADSKPWPYLKYSKEEGKTVHRLLNEHSLSSTLLTEEAGTESYLKELTTAPQIIHIASHGFFYPRSVSGNARGLARAENPLLRSGLVLSGANRIRRMGEGAINGNDGILTALEVSALNLKGTELVVLSACETGLGDIEGSEGVYGLQRAFKTAGVKYVLMSLWRVDDERTYQFMQRFYTHLLKGFDVPEAYRRTQIDLQRKHSAPFDPRAWAGFVLLE